MEGVARPQRHGPEQPELSPVAALTKHLDAQRQDGCQIYNVKTCFHDCLHE